MEGHQSTDRRVEERTHPVDNCPRCGEDHGAVVFREIEQPIATGDGVYAWWWLCETENAPVLACLSWEEC